MAKKTFTEQFRDFVKASPGQSNVPMTRKEIATAQAKKKTKQATANRAAKKTAKKTAKKVTKKKTKKRAIR
jgi:hypothetical protein